LLYNLAAFGRQDFFWPTAVPRAGGIPLPSGAAGDGFLPGARAAGKGPPTIRQKFLAGRRVDVNRATMAEISELPGVSDKVAQAVIAERGRIGRFRHPADLLGVAGIKEKRLHKILPFISGFDNN
jgi:competence protein ComEA